jgi:hypothetical protein
MPYAALKGRSSTVAHARVALTGIFSRPVYAIDRSSFALPGLCSHFVSPLTAAIFRRYAAAAFALATRPRSLALLGGFYDLQSSFLQGFLFALDSPFDGVDEIGA